MATQTVTVSRAPVGGSSRSTGTPAASGAVDYSLTDLDLLEAPGAPADEATREEQDARKGNAEGQNETAAANQESADASADEQAHGPTPKDRGRATAEFEPAFELPEIGPKLREICERDAEYREVFPTVAEARAVREIFSTPDAARAAASAQAELARLDRLVESRDPRAHAELLAGLQRLSPQAFRDLALTFGERLAALDPEAHRQVSAAMAAQALAGERWPEQVSLLSRAVEQQDWPAVKFLSATLASQIEQLRGRNANESARAAGASRPEASGRIAPLRAPVDSQPRPTAPPPGAAYVAANQFLETVNTGVEQAVHASVAGKVAELLPDAPEGARQKIAGEIYRELDQTLRQDPELLEQVRDSVRGALQVGDWRAAQSGRPPAERVAQLITGRARAALPAVAKRVVADWTETVLRSSRERRSRQAESASRVEVGRGGAPNPVPLKPRGVDYTRMTDEEILNMD